MHIIIQVEMKLVINYQQQVKLFSEPIVYDVLLAYVQAQFNLPSHNIEMTFTDQEGDNITIASNDDIDILTSYYTGKEYVKVTVKASPIINPPIIPPQSQEIKQQKPKVKKNKNKSKSKKEKVANNEQKKEVSKKQKVVKEVSQKKPSMIQQIKKLMSLAVAQMVDERIKALIPCIREQVHNPVKKEHRQMQIVIEGSECSLCLAKPIKGIRYDCPTCHSFTICSQCQQIAEHPHNLLKVKHLQAKEQKESNYVDKVCKLITERQEQLAKKKEKSLQKKQQDQKQQQQLKEKLKNAKKCLTQLFGSQPAYYNEFVKKNKKASIEEIVNKYVQVNQISSQEYKQKLIILQNTRLCNKFKRQGNFYKEFVRHHLSFDLNTIIKAMYKQGVEKKPNKQQKQAKSKEKSKEVKQEIKKEVRQVKQVKQEIKQQVLLQPIPRKFSSKIEGSSQLKGQKLQTLNMMIEFFGPTHQAQYMRFIEANQSYGREQILQNWANKFSVLNP